MLDELLELARDQAALLFHPAIEGHRLRIRAQARVQLPIRPCMQNDPLCLTISQEPIS